MYKLAYAHEVDDSPGTSRERERRAFDRAIELLEEADKENRSGTKSVEALIFTRRLWSILVEDLTRDTNELPEETRGQLISIGLWVLKECEEIRLGRSENYRGLIDVSRSIRDGLE